MNLALGLFKSFLLVICLLITGFGAIEIGELIEGVQTFHEFLVALHLVNLNTNMQDFAIATSQLAALDWGTQSEMTTELAIKLHIFPANMISDDKVINAFGGEIIVGHTEDGKMYLYTNKIPKDGCISAISSDLASFPYLAVNSVYMSSRNQALKNCQDNNNQILFSFSTKYPSAFLPSATTQNGSN